MRARSVAVWSKWRGLVSEQELSGQSVSAFFRERGLCAPHMFSWKKRLRVAEAGGFLEVQVLDALAPSHSQLLPGKAIEGKRQTKCMVGIFAAQAAGVRSAMCRSGTLASPGRISAR